MKATFESEEALEETPVKKPRSIVWKFFNLLENGKFVQCQLCGERNKDGRLAYHSWTTSMHEHLKRHHPAAINVNEGNSLSDSAEVKQHKIESYT